MNFYGKGIIRSMMIAYKNRMRPVITVQYPHEKVELPERSRWAVAMKPDDEGQHKCTGCQACEKACPDYIIELQITQREDKTKHIDHWRYEIGACMMCGLCVEACPFDAILMSHEYELARIDKSLLVIDLLTDVEAAKPKRKEPAAGAVPTSAPRPAPADPAPAAEATTTAEATTGEATADDATGASASDTPAPADDADGGADGD